MTVEKLVDQLVMEIIATETNRKRQRSAEAHKNFLNGIAHLVINAWQAEESMSAAPISLQKNRYSKRYGPTHLTYQQTASAFRGLTSLGYIRKTQSGFFDRSGAGNRP